ncbi:MAG: hypothetical protein ACEQSR_00310 [Candidatus Methylacidiphilales bacterium]
MKHLIEIDDELPNGKLVLQLLKELNLSVKPKDPIIPLTQDDLIFGIGRPATNEEMFELSERIKKETFSNSINDLLKEFEE